MIKKHIKLFIISILSLLLAGACYKNNQVIEMKENDFLISKLWAHKTNDTAEAKRKKELFSGLEVDLYYSDYQKIIYVGHEAWDTITGLTFAAWLKALPSPEKTYYWLDMKNLNVNNANEIAEQIMYLTNKYEITSNVMVEHTDWQALKIIKEKGLKVILWVDNLYWWSEKDTIRWYDITKNKIESLQPEAISCEYRMFPLLNQSFPAENVFFWNTPIEDSVSNRNLTREMCLDTSVKVVLVDYESINQ